MWEATGSQAPVPLPSVGVPLPPIGRDTTAPSTWAHPYDSSLRTTQGLVPRDGLTKGVIWMPQGLLETSWEGCPMGSPLPPDTGADVCPAWALMLILLFSLVALFNSSPAHPPRPHPQARLKGRKGHV